MAFLVAFEHAYFYYLEAIVWETKARKIFRTTKEQARSQSYLGAYNSTSPYAISAEHFAAYNLTYLRVWLISCSDRLV